MSLIFLNWLFKEKNKDELAFTSMEYNVDSHISATSKQLGETVYKRVWGSEFSRVSCFLQH